MAVKQEERRNIRLMTGQTNPDTGAALAAKGAIPLQKVQSGKFTTVSKEVLGDSNTEFDTEFDTDTWLYSVSLNEVRQIKEVNGVNMVLYHAFSANIAVLEDVYRVEAQVYTSVVTKNNGGADALVQEVLLPDGEVDIRDFDLGCAPFTYDAQTSQLMFQISE